MSDFTIQQKQFMDELFTKLSNTFSEQNTELRNEFKEHLTEIKLEISSSATIYQEKIAKLEEENKSLRSNIVQLQRKVRKNNIIIFGIDNKVQNLLEFVITNFNNILEVNIQEGEINDIYRIGAEDKENRAVVVELISYQTKKLILKNAKKLKGHNLFISQDQCVEDRKKHKILIEHQKKARQNGVQAYIKGHVVVIHGESYTAEDLQNNPYLTYTQESQDTEKPNSAPATPNPQVRQKRLYSELGLEEDDNIDKKTKPAEKTENTNNKGGTSKRIINNKQILTRSNSASKK